MTSAWKVIHSSKDMSWRTPPELFNHLNREFHFGLDAAASNENTLCDYYLPEKEDALNTDWSRLTFHGNSVWLNPPYGRTVHKWVKKAYQESRKGLTVVLLIMACTETKWWGEYVWKADEVRLIQGRLRFLDSSGKPQNAAPKGSAIVVFRPHWEGPPRVSLMPQEWK